MLCSCSWPMRSTIVSIKIIHMLYLWKLLNDDIVYIIKVTAFPVCSISRHTRMHSDPFSWLCITRRKELGVALDRAVSFNGMALWSARKECTLISIWAQPRYLVLFIFWNQQDMWISRGSSDDECRFCHARCLPAWRGSQGYLGSSGVSTMSINTVILPIQSTLLWNPSYK